MVKVNFPVNRLTTIPT